MNLVWKLLRENVSKVQLAGFFIANLIGMSIILVAIQFYFDVNTFFSGKDELFNNNFITITKKVNLLNAFSSRSSGFTSKEIEEISNQIFVDDVGAFVPSQYEVYAGIEQNNIRFGTEIFFESVPDKFIDVETNDWSFTPGSNSVPIILPKNYLDLYNFGFAESRSMPKISEGMAGMVSIDITVFGSGGSKRMKGRIVGFSNRINTILVPEAFMIWANNSFGAAARKKPSRLILQINNIADPQLEQFFKEKGYEVEGENTAASRIAFFLKIMVSIVVAVGLIICLLSITILTLSIYLLLEKNMDKLQKLRLIGYGKAVVTRPYELLVIVINFAILFLSVVVVFIVRAKYSGFIGQLLSDYNPVSMIYSVAAGFVIFAILCVLNVYIIRSKVI